MTIYNFHSPLTTHQYSSLINLCHLASAMNCHCGYLLSFTSSTILTCINPFPLFRRVPEGCLEACLPDISYQRHIARGSSLRPSFVMGRAFRPLVTPYSPRLSHAVHDLLHNLKTTCDPAEKRNGVNGLLRRRSHSLENLSLT